MKFDLRMLALFAVLGATPVFGACVGPPDEQPLWFTRATLDVEAVPVCNADDLAAVDTFVPVLDDASEVVGLLMGEPLCRCAVEAVESRDEREMVLFMLQLDGQGSPKDRPLNATDEDPTVVVQDPTPQPARPGDRGFVLPLPVWPTPTTSNSEKN